MNKRGGLPLVFLTALISGISIFINKFSVSVINPYIFTFLKNVIVVIFLVSIILLTRNLKEIKKLNKKQWSQLVLIGLIGGSIPFLLFFKGLSLTSGATSSFIHKTMFIYVALLATFFLKEKLNKKIFISAILLLLGNLLLLKLTSFSFNRGDLLVLVATLLWAGENTLSKHVLKQLSGNVLAFGRMFFGSIFILIFLALANQLPLLSQLTAIQILWTLLTSSILLLFLLTWYNGIKHVKITVATSILLLGSPITTFLSIIFSRTPVALPEITGILLIFLGVLSTIYFLEKTTSKAPQHTHSEY